MSIWDRFGRYFLLFSLIRLISFLCSGYKIEGKIGSFLFGNRVVNWYDYFRDWLEVGIKLKICLYFNLVVFFRNLI